MSPTSDVFDSFEDQVKNQQTEMDQILSLIDVENVKSEGMVLSIGGKHIKFTGVEISEDDIEAKIRREFKDKLNAQQQRIREKINTKVNQLLTMHRQKTEEMARKEAELERKYQNSAKMPDITHTHLIKGLSVVKGSTNDELKWVFRGVYNPKFLDHKPLPQRLVNRMKKNIIILIVTKANNITQVSTREIQNNVLNHDLEYFDHYHQNSPDCWGQWTKPNLWSTPDDIIKAAKDAEAVLQNVNSGSVAKRNPGGLPRLDTLKRNTEDVEPYDRSDIQSGNEEVDVWST